MKKTAVKTIYPLFLIFSIVMSACGAQPVGITPTPYPTPQKKTYTVQRGDIVINTELFGSIFPLTLATVNFQMDGHVGNVYVQVNDKVSKGELLADLDELNSLQSQNLEIIDEINRAQINLDISRLTLDKLKSEGASIFDIQIQEKKIELAQMDLNEVMIKNGIDPSTNAINALQVDTDKAKVFAPVEGVIISGVNPGRAVSTSTIAFTIGDGSRSEIIASIDPGKVQDTLKNLFEGMPVMINPNSDPGFQLSGKISTLPSPYGTGNAGENSIHVLFDSTPQNGKLKFGDTVTVHIQIANKVSIIWLPPAAIREVGGRTFVIVNGENGPKRIDIGIGLQTSDKVEIVSGLNEGQVVIGQ